MSAEADEMATGFEKLMRAAGTAASKVRRDHATGLIAKTPVVAMLDPAELDALDAWIASKPEPRPSRSEAMRLILVEKVAPK
jgi:hypothetical protein